MKRYQKCGQRLLQGLAAAGMVLCVALGALMPARAAAAFTPSFTPKAKAALLLDLTTGEVLYAKNANARMQPSVAALMVNYLLSAEKLTDTTATVRATANAIKLPKDVAKLGLRRYEKLPVQDLLQATLVGASADAANVLATAAGDGDRNRFVQLMNEKAESLGCTGTKFTNAYGGYDPESYTTAQDIAKIYQQALKNGKFKDTVAKQSCSISRTNYRAARTLQAANALMIEGDAAHYANCTGGVAASSAQGGDSLAATAGKDGRNLLCVALDAPASSANAAFADSKQLFDWAYSMQQREVLAAGKAVGRLSVKGAENAQQTVSAVAKKAVSAVLPADLDLGKLETAVSLPKQVEAPVQKDQKLGTVTLRLQDKVLGTADLVAAEAVEKFVPVYEENWFETAMPIVLAAAVLVLVVLLFILLGRRRKRRKNRYKGSSRRGKGGYYHNYH